MKSPKIIALLAPVLLLTACQEKGVPQAEYDQLLEKYNAQTSELQEMSSLIDEVNGSVELIAKQEGMLFLNTDDDKAPSKKELLDRFAAFQGLIENQKARIDSLQNLVSSDSRNMNALQKVITSLKEQLAEKQMRIAELEEELKVKNTDIKTLQTKVETVATQLAGEKESASFFEEVAATQDAIINQGYFIVASKKELKDLGLVSGVFKKKANYANIDKSHFTQVDIREFSEIRIEDEPKLITDKPESSYSITKNNDGSYTLRITNPSDFWAASPFLIIQAK